MSTYWVRSEQFDYEDPHKVVAETEQEAVAIYADVMFGFTGTAALTALVAESKADLEDGLGKLHVLSWGSRSVS